MFFFIQNILKPENFKDIMKGPLDSIMQEVMHNNVAMFVQCQILLQVKLKDSCMSGHSLKNLRPNI